MFHLFQFEFYFLHVHPNKLHREEKKIDTWRTQRFQILYKNKITARDEQNPHGINVYTTYLFTSAKCSASVSDRSVVQLVSECVCVCAFSFSVSVSLLFFGSLFIRFQPMYQTNVSTKTTTAPKREKRKKNEDKNGQILLLFPKKKSANRFSGNLCYCYTNPTKQQTIQPKKFQPTATTQFI